MHRGLHFENHRPGSLRQMHTARQDDDMQALFLFLEVARRPRALRLLSSLLFLDRHHRAIADM